MADSVLIRPRLQSDMDACVSLLRQLHEHDNYALTWPADPHAWLCGNRQVMAWVASRGEIICGHAAITIPVLARRPPAHGKRACGVEQSGLLSVALLFVAPPEMATGRLRGRACE
jgi:[ribosomal protein S18]-alanine N-acetyltransferase